MGLYGFIENYRNPWLKNEFNGGEKMDVGFLYQGMSGSPTTGSRSDLSYRGDNVTAYADGAYRLKEAPKADKADTKKDAGDEDKEDPVANPVDFTKLMEYTKFLEQGPVNGSDAVNAWKEKMDMESVIRKYVN